MKSAEISNGTEAVRTPCSFDDSINSAGKRVLPRRIQTAAIAGVPGLRWKVSATSRWLSPIARCTPVSVEESVVVWTNQTVFRSATAAHVAVGPTV